MNLIPACPGHYHFKWSALTILYRTFETHLSYHMYDRIHRYVFDIIVTQKWVQIALRVFLSHGGWSKWWRRTEERAARHWLQTVHLYARVPLPPASANDLRLSRPDRHVQHSEESSTVQRCCQWLREHDGKLSCGGSLGGLELRWRRPVE